MVVRRVIIPVVAIIFLLATLVVFVFNLIYLLNQKSFNWFYFGVFILFAVITIVLSRFIDSFGPEITYKMDIKDFQRVWETEYIKARVDRVIEALELGKFESALVYLNMIQDKAKAAERLIKVELNKK